MPVGGPLLKMARLMHDQTDRPVQNACRAEFESRPRAGLWSSGSLRRCRVVHVQLFQGAGMQCRG